MLLGSNLNVSTVVATDAAVDSNTTTTTTEPEKNTYKWTYPFKACDKMSTAQTFGMTDYMRSVNPPSYFHDGWDFGHSEVGYSPVYTIHEVQLRKLLMIAA